MLCLTILGSGTCVPSLSRNSPAYFIEIAATNILVDCGSGALLQLEKAGKSYRDIDYVFLTHFHADHISDLFALIQALNWTPGFKRQKDLTLVGSKGTTVFYTRFLMPILGLPDAASYAIRTLELDPYPAEEKLDNFIVKSVNTTHTENSIALRFETESRSLVISGDCDYDERIIELARDADLLILECSFTDEEKVSGHLTPSECGTIAKLANVKKLILSHIYPTSSDKIRLAQCRSRFDGKVVIARDLMKFTL
jgi:ribonuclease BN (tRNA processing enzyme)